MLSASIRGIGQDDFAFNLDPGVGVYVDGVYYARTVGANQDVLDVDHVEILILNGPQGTLFGRNTIGGAISIVTHTPAAELRLRGQVSAGSYKRHDISLMADIPLSLTVLTTVTFSSQQREGYERRIPLPNTKPYVSDPVGAFHNSGTETFDTQGGQNQQTARAKLLWKAAGNFTATATADWVNANQPSPATTVLGTYGAAQGAVFNTFYSSITGWREVQWKSGSDLSGSPVPMLDLTFAEDQRQISQEVHLLGDVLDSKLRYVADLYYFNESGFIHDYVVFGDGLLQIDGPNSLRTDQQDVQRCREHGDCRP